MNGIRTLTGGIAAWVALSCSAAAAPLSWFDSQATLTAWYANQLSTAGNIYAPPTSANAITNLPASFYYRPTSPPVAAPVAAPVPVSAALIPVAAPAIPNVDKPVISAAAVSSTINATPAALTYTRQPTFGATTSTADAFINLGGQPYAEASSLTVGDPKPWYQSPAAIAAFGGTPTADQQAGFANDVLSKVERTFQLSGIDVKLTSDPGVPASHMMSVVSGASYSANPDAIGITSVGDDGFSFIDKLNYASNADQLSWAVAHNVAHELMHAFGVGDHPDQTGDYIDAAVANWNLLTDPNTKFSPAAVSLMKTLSNGASSETVGAELLKTGLLAAQCGCGFCDSMTGFGIDGAQVLASAVPEPSTVAVWILAGLGGGLTLRRHGRRQAA
ncbi:hypothetical protein [Planctomyces sp. SH-PL62]|uniref:hypothetical protein n=1 Tax=Planctomyces sp. SH-PL62 TaxID=1636152 RepID=UPI00078CB5B8|nr:hypothetical protein [Planctomyces sp. SH-PL62]AMV39598.1 hypothetical protein VT85_19340 [Planctomyces sp. SH-PL62]